MTGPTSDVVAPDTTTLRVSVRPTTTSCVAGSNCSAMGISGSTRRASGSPATKTSEAWVTVAVRLLAALTAAPVMVTVVELTPAANSTGLAEKLALEPSAYARSTATCCWWKMAGVPRLTVRTMEFCTYTKALVASVDAAAMLSETVSSAYTVTAVEAAAVKIDAALPLLSKVTVAPVLTTVAVNVTVAVRVVAVEVKVTEAGENVPAADWGVTVRLVPA